jgi:hypothetical protein
VLFRLDKDQAGIPAVASPFSNLESAVVLEEKLSGQPSFNLPGFGRRMIWLVGGRINEATQM